MDIREQQGYSRPEGGYGWLIVFAIFVCLACVNGLQKANGLYFVYLMDYYSASNSAISAITFVQKIAEIFTALIWSILAERYGSRLLVFCGGILAVVGFVLSSLAQNVTMITLTYGAICGMAFPMIVFPALQMLPRYFDKKLVLASALIFCRIYFSPLLVAALHLHVLAAALLLRPYVPDSAKSNLPPNTACNPLPVNINDSITALATVYEASDNPCLAISSTPEKMSSDLLEKYPASVQEPSELPKKRSISRTISEAAQDEAEDTPRARNFSVACLSVGSPAPCPPIAPTTSHILDAEISVVRERTDLNVFRVIIGKYKDLACNKLFLLLGVSTFMHAFTMSTYGTFQQAYLKDIGFGADNLQMLVIMISSVAELISRLFFGFIINKNWLKSYQWNQIACVLISASIFVYPFVTNFLLVLFINSFIVVIYSICVVTVMPNFSEFIGIDLAPIGQGLNVIPNGLGMVSVQIGGVLRDYTGSFRPAFYMAGGALIISAFNFQIIHLLSARCKKNVELAPSTSTGSEKNRPKYGRKHSSLAANNRIFSDQIIESLHNEQNASTSR